MIVVLSANTAVDRILLVPHFQPGHVYKARSVQPNAGGKGLNVARALRRLGEPVRVVGFLGGVPEPFIRAQCEALGIEQRWVETAGESRTCAIVVDPTTGEQTVINEPGPTVSEGEQGALLAAVEEAVDEGDILCISGSAPPGVPDSFYAEVVRRVRVPGARTLADVSGSVLAQTLQAGPWAVAPNEEEARGALEMEGRPEDLARALARRTEVALVTLGGEGVVVAQGDRVWRVQPPPIRLVNAVASGDAFAAGFLAGLQRGESVVDAVRLGVACGASNASRMEPDIGDAAEIEQLLRRIAAHTET